MLSSIHELGPPWLGGIVFQLQFVRDRVILRFKFTHIGTKEIAAVPSCSIELFNFRFEFATGNNQKTMGGTAYGPRLPTYQTMRRELIRDDEPTRPSAVVS